MWIFYHLFLLFIVFKLNILRSRKSTIYLCYSSIWIPFYSILVIFYRNLYPCLLDIYGLFMLFMALEVDSYRICWVIWLCWLCFFFVIASFILFLEFSCNLFTSYVMLLFDRCGRISIYQLFHILSFLFLIVL